MRPPGPRGYELASAERRCDGVVPVELGQMDRDIRSRSRHRPEPGAPVIMRQDLLVVPAVHRGVTISAPLAHAVAVPEAETSELDHRRGRLVCRPCRRDLAPLGLGL